MAVDDANLREKTKHVNLHLTLVFVSNFGLKS